MQTDEIKDFRVVGRIKNNRILKAIEQSGYSNVNDFCLSNGFSPSEIGKYINLKKSPISPSGHVRETAIKMCDKLGFDIDDMFSDEQKWLELESNSFSREVTAEEIRAIGSHDRDPIGRLEHDISVQSLIDQCLSNQYLTEREIEVVKKVELEGLTLEEFGRSLGLSRERIRQIYSKALRKMRKFARETFNDVDFFAISEMTTGNGD